MTKEYAKVDNTNVVRCENTYSDLGLTRAADNTSSIEIQYSKGLPCVYTYIQNGNMFHVRDFRNDKGQIILFRKRL